MGWSADPSVGGATARSTAEGHPVPSRIVRYGLPASLAGLVFLCFRPVLSNQFVNWDDEANFVRNVHYRGLSPGHLRWMFTTLHLGHYQPLTWVTHGLVYSIWGMNPEGYHLVNLLLHMANAIVFYLLLLALLRQPWSTTPYPVTDGMRAAAALGAAFFAVHPLRVEVVAWATERNEVLCAFFLLLAVLAYVHSQSGSVRQRQRYYLLSLGAYELSLLSKETGLTLPIVLVVLDAYPLRRLSGPSRPQPGMKVLIEKLPYALLACGAAGAALQARVPLANEGVIGRVMQAAYGLCFYLWKTLIPTALSPLYLLERPFDPSRPRYVLAAFAVAAGTVALILLRRRYPWAVLAATCYAVTLLPVLGLVQGGLQLVADRYSYWSCLPWAALVAAGTYRLCGGWHTNPAGSVVRSCVVAGLIAVLAIYGTQTNAQTRVWRDSLTLWNRALSIEPANQLALANRGAARLANGDADGALADYSEALRLNPQSATAYNGRGAARQAKGDLAGALSDYESALQSDAQLATAYSNRAKVRQAMGDVTGALNDYDQAVRLSEEAGIFFARGAARQTLGDLEGALADYTAAIRLNPDDPKAYNNRAIVRQQLGDAAGASADCDRVRRLDPHGGLCRQ